MVRLNRMGSRILFWIIIIIIFALLVFRIGSTGHKNRRDSTIPVCYASNSRLESRLENKAQKALDAIGANCTPTASYERAKQGQHVFNKGLLKFHRNVLKDLLKDVGGYEQLDNLVQDLMIPLSQSVIDSIKEMVAHFRSDEDGPYVDFNACVFGKYVLELRKALVAYLKANTSVNENDENVIQAIIQRVELIADQMVNHEVYVDPMARDCWLKHNHQRGSRKKYNQVIDALKSGPMFRNIPQAFQNVSDKIRVFRMNNNHRL